MVNQLDKLNKAQVSTLRKLFSGRTADNVFVDATISKVTIEFGPCVHWLMLGPRGGIVYHEKGSKA